MASVRLEHISKRFGGVTAVNDVNLVVEDQEFLVLLGPSGCGKTTTLRMVAGLEDVSDGQIRIDEKDVSQLPPKDRNIAMVFQNYALYPHMTVYENMAFGLKLHKVPRPEIERRVKDAANILGLDSLLHRRPKELSGGQRQRVALGRAIVRDPKVFLMDEPLSNLDAKLRTQTRVELKRLHQRLGATIIYVTHDQTEAMTMGTRIVVMRDGVVQQVDSPDHIYHQPANLFVASFVGTPAMNLMKASFQRENGQVVGAVAGQRFVLSSRIAQAIDALSQPQMILGIRPEDVTIAGTENVSDGEATLKGRVRLIEPLGHEHIVYVDLGDEDMVVRTSNAWSGSQGESVLLRLNQERLHAFDPDTELSLFG